MTKGKKKVGRVSPTFDAWVMLRVFRGCIDTRTFPAINSPCHAKLLEIIERLGVVLDGRRKGR